MVALKDRVSKDQEIPKPKDGYDYFFDGGVYSESYITLKSTNKDDFENLKDDLNKIMILDQYKLNIRDILFEGYQKKSYNYYLEREIDKKVSKLLETKNVWLFGNSGVGKTNIAQYYFHNKDCFFHSTYFTTIEDNVNNYLNILSLFQKITIHSLKFIIFNFFN